MSALQVFLVAFLISYAGSIPPGSINVSVMQLSIQGQRAAALALGFGAVLVEFVYAGTAVKFLQLLQEQPDIYFILQMITGFGLLGLGIVSFMNKSNVNSVRSDSRVRKRAGFGKGLVLGLINPLSIPFWLGITTYLLDQKLISVTGYLYWVYLSGLAVGTYALLGSVDLLGSRFRQIANNPFIVHRLPGILFSLMGVYYLLSLWTSS